VVTHPREAERLGLRPLARLTSWAVAGVPPRTMGIGPVPATARALERAGLKLSDFDLIELNEAFAAQVLACTREWGFGDADWHRTNVNGSGISLGTRSALPAAGSSPRCCANWTAAAAGTGWRRCASAAGRVWPPSSSG
jgi:acetyl-CoA acetyltransferase